jgi:hypothetical protein
MNIAVFYHCLFYLGDPPDLSERAIRIVMGHVAELRRSGLMNHIRELQVGVNGGQESLVPARMLFPGLAKIHLHGLDSRNENSTIRLVEQWLPNHPGWLVLYFHSKGATHTDKDAWKAKWGDCMLRNCVTNWRQCVADLEAGYESVGSHWMTGKKTPPGQSIWAGNFWWSKSDFLRTLPSILDRDRIKISGLKSVDSRYESEVWIGNGPRLPRIKDYHPDWDPNKMHTCTA